MTKHVSDSRAERPLPLSRQINRIARSLASSSFVGAGASSNSNGSDFEVQADTVLEIIRARRARAIYFPGELFSDSAWDILLELLHAEVAFRRVSVPGLSADTGIPVTVVPRWLDALAEKGLVAFDAGFGNVRLSANASGAFRQYLRDIFQPD